MSAHILVIDDESQIRKMLRIALKSVGYQVSEAESVATGLAAVVRQQPDLVVLDLGLPDGNGLELLTELRSFSKVPVIILSVRSGDADKARYWFNDSYLPNLTFVGATPVGQDPVKAPSNHSPLFFADEAALPVGVRALDHKQAPVPLRGLLLTPLAAESWTMSEDGLTWTFKLREGLKWSDGEPLTAEDYVFALQRTNRDMLHEEGAKCGVRQLIPAEELGHVLGVERSVDAGFLRRGEGDRGQHGIDHPHIAQVAPVRRTVDPGIQHHAIRAGIGMRRLQRPLHGEIVGRLCRQAGQNGQLINQNAVQILFEQNRHTSDDQP